MRIKGPFYREPVGYDSKYGTHYLNQTSVVIGLDLEIRSLRQNVIARHFHGKKGRTMAILVKKHVLAQETTQTNEPVVTDH